MANPIVEEIMKSPRDQEIVFDGDEAPERYLKMLEFMANAGSDVLAMIPPRVVVSKHESLCNAHQDGRILLGQAFGRYLYQESKAN